MFEDLTLIVLHYSMSTHAIFVLQTGMRPQIVWFVEERCYKILGDQSNILAYNILTYNNNKKIE